MIPTLELFKRVDQFLSEKGRSPLTHQEVIYTMMKMEDAVLEARNTSELEGGLAICAARSVCELRGYKVPVGKSNKELLTTYLDARKNKYFREDLR